VSIQIPLKATFLSTNFTSFQDSNDLNFQTLPNTIYWNAGKHNGITKKIKTKEIEFRSNEGIAIIYYTLI